MLEKKVDKLIQVASQNIDLYGEVVKLLNTKFSHLNTLTGFDYYVEESGLNGLSFKTIPEALQKVKADRLANPEPPNNSTTFATPSFKNIHVTYFNAAETIEITEPNIILTFSDKAMIYPTTEDAVFNVTANNVIFKNVSFIYPKAMASNTNKIAINATSKVFAYINLLVNAQSIQSLQGVEWQVTHEFNE